MKIRRSVIVFALLSLAGNAMAQTQVTFHPKRSCTRLVKEKKAKFKKIVKRDDRGGVSSTVISLKQMDTVSRKLFYGKEPVGVWIVGGKRLDYNFELIYLSEDEVQDLYPDSIVVNESKTKTVDQQVEMNFRTFVARNTVYHSLAIENDWEGTSRILFVVDSTGNITDVRIREKTFVLLDKEAARVVREAPDFPVRMIRGKPVSIRYRFPVRFKLY